MRWLLVAMTVAGCGRVGFDAGPDAPPAELQDICDARPTSTLPLMGGETVTTVRATRLSGGGYAVAVGTDLPRAWVLRVDASGATVSTHLPFPSGYELHGISQIAGRPFVYVYTGGTGYLKLLQPTWDDYDTGPEGDTLPLDPQQALLPGGALAFYGVIASSVLTMRTIDVDGVQGVTASYAPTAEHAAFAATPGGVRVVAANAGTCETFAITPAGAAGPRTTISTCAAPRIAMLDDDAGAVLYEQGAGGPLAIRQLAGAAETESLGTGPNARIATIGGALVVGYRDAAGAGQLVRHDAGTYHSSSHPAVAFPFDFADPEVFWVEGAEVHTGELCLR